jgi:probable phosphoglycerate mutase
VTTTVFLVRHGAHDRLGRILCGRMHGVTLSEEGRRQAAAVAAWLGGETLEAVYASPLERTRETAQPIAAAVGVTATLDPDLSEIDFGEWTGKAFDDLDGDPAWAAWNRARALARPPGGESMVEVQSRVRHWLDLTRARHPMGRVAAVTHGDVIKALLAAVLGFSMDQHDRLEVSPASVTTLLVGDWGMKVMGVNETIR